MTIEELNASKVPIIVFDKKLEELRDTVLFPEKLAKAKEILSKSSLPKRNNANKSFATSGVNTSQQ